MKLNRILQLSIIFLLVFVVIFSIVSIGAYLVDRDFKNDNFTVSLGPQTTSLTYSVYNTKTDEIMSEVPIKLIGYVTLNG